ncbi:hypothetical protein PWG14_26675, partial [Chromobacterium amazonense]|uniref:hypothetical protein n=1 Tax=Chromobacterium amazonense TaxID=1382803 RepID=UPI00237D8915
GDSMAALLSVSFCHHKFRFESFVMIAAPNQQRKTVACRKYTVKLTCCIHSTYSTVGSNPWTQWRVFINN